MAETHGFALPPAPSQYLHQQLCVDCQLASERAGNLNPLVRAAGVVSCELTAVPDALPLNRVTAFFECCFTWVRMGQGKVREKGEGENKRDREGEKDNLPL